MIATACLASFVGIASASSCGLDESPAGNEMAMQARIVPAFKDGVAQGFKLFSIGPGSFYARVGIKNGDVVTGVNGYPFTSPEEVLEAYSALKDALHFELTVERDGKPLRLSWARPPATILTGPAPLPTTRPYELVGVLLGDDPAKRSAVVRNIRTGRSRTVREGEEFDGLRIEHVTRGRVLVARPWLLDNCEPRRELILPPVGKTSWTERSSSAL